MVLARLAFFWIRFIGAPAQSQISDNLSQPVHSHLGADERGRMIFREANWKTLEGYSRRSYTRVVGRRSLNRMVILWRLHGARRSSYLGIVRPFSSPLGSKLTLPSSKQQRSAIRLPITPATRPSSFSPPPPFKKFILCFAHPVTSIENKRESYQLKTVERKIESACYN